MMFRAFFCFYLWLLGDLILAQQQLSVSNPPLKQISTLNGLSGVSTDETETISVMEGDSVTLNTDVTEMQNNRMIAWTFRRNSSDTDIAEIYKQIIFIYDKKENNERFRDRLQIDKQTGSLTITNINKSHSGLYKVMIMNEDVKHKTFNITVYGILTVPIIIRDSSSSSSSSSSSNCSLVCSVVNVSHVTLSWYKGNSLLSSISVSDLSISLSLPLEIQCVDDSYSCIVSYSFTNRTKHLNIIDLCHTCAESSQTLFPLVVSLLLLFLLLSVTVVVVLIFCRRRKYTQAKLKDRINEEEVDYTEATFIKHQFQEMEADEREQTVYSEVDSRR